ncbi:MAG: hypothetical protein ABIA63_13135 [bacterium]
MFCEKHEAKIDKLKKEITLYPGHEQTIALRYDLIMLYYMITTECSGMRINYIAETQKHAQESLKNPPLIWLMSEKYFVKDPVIKTFIALKFLECLYSEDNTKSPDFVYQEFAQKQELLKKATQNTSFFLVNYHLTMGNDDFNFNAINLDYVCRFLCRVYIEVVKNNYISSNDEAIL